jgi:hypothetical protein
MIGMNAFDNTGVFFILTQIYLHAASHLDSVNEAIGYFPGIILRQSQWYDNFCKHGQVVKIKEKRDLMVFLFIYEP